MMTAHRLLLICLFCASAASSSLWAQDAERMVSFGLDAKTPTGYLRTFEAPGDGRWLNGIEVAAVRARPTDMLASRPVIGLFILDGDRHVLRQVLLPLMVLPLGSEPKWTRLPFPPVQVPKNYGIGIVFPPIEDCYFMLGLSGDTAHGFSWLPGGEAGPASRGCPPALRATVGNEPAGDPQADDLVVLQDGQVLLEHVTGFEGTPPTVKFAQHQPVPVSQVAYYRLDAVQTPPSMVNGVLKSGEVIGGEVISSADGQLRLQMNGEERVVPLADIREMSIVQQYNW